MTSSQRPVRRPLLRQGLSLGALSLLPLSLLACGQDLEAQADPPQSTQQAALRIACNVPVIDDTRSLAVTEQAILDKTFSFERVMTQIAATSLDPTDTKERLYREWFDTQNDARSAVTLDARHCDEITTASGQALFNDFPYQCPRAEGQLASTDPYRTPETNPDAYIPIGLFNRFDLAQSGNRYGGGGHCGEYRIIFAKRSGAGGVSGRNLIIFEGILPNPAPHKGFSACAPVADFWASLSSIRSTSARQSLLEAFYFDGLPGFEPVVKAAHYGPLGGQIRTNQFVERDWNLREFKFDEGCPIIKPIDPIKLDPSLPTLDLTPRQEPCRAQIVQDTVKVNPFGPLFDVNSPSFDPAFEQFFAAQTPSLAVADINAFNMADDERFNPAESDSQLPAPGVYDQQLGTSGSLHAAINAALPPASGLTPTHIARRAKALSCAGCHELSNNDDLGAGIRWPNSLGFVHVSEFASNGSFPISPALSNVFLPHRRQVLTDFIQSQCVTTICANRFDLDCLLARQQSKTLPTTGTLSGTSRVH